MGTKPRAAASDDFLEAAAAEKLWSAAAGNVLITPLRTGMPHANLTAGYRVQALNVARGISAGRVAAGYKIAMTSTAAQKQFGIVHPTCGIVFADTIIKSGATVEAPIQGRVEGEVAFQIAHDIEVGEPTLTQLISCVARALPAIEIVDCRISGWDVAPFDFVADNAAASLVVLGIDEIALEPAELADIPMQMRINEEVRATGSGADCAESPLRALHWLAVHLGQSGRHLRAGDIVMSGSLGPAVAIAAGDRVDIRVGSARPVYAQFS